MELKIKAWYRKDFDTNPQPVIGIVSLDIEKSLITVVDTEPGTGKRIADKTLCFADVFLFVWFGHWMEVSTINDYGHYFEGFKKMRVD